MMMTQTYHNVYLDHLAAQIGFDRKYSYRDLLILMYTKEFVWFVPNDDNRIIDGLEIRREWANYAPLERNYPCSFLEVLIGLSRRMEFVLSESAEGWAWQLLINLEMHKMRDPLSRYKAKKANDIMDAVIWRTYASNGAGGFFPLGFPQEDQRKIELWYQMSAYVSEIHPEY